MCGLLGLLTSSADAATRADGRRAGDALRSAPRTGRKRHLARFGRRLRVQPAVDHRRGALAPAAALGSVRGRRSLRDRLQRRGLQLPGAARRARGAGGDVRHRGRHRGGRRRLPPLGPGRGVPAARHVRLRDLGQPSERVLFVARDPFGIKPLFVAEGPAASRSPARRRASSSSRPALGLATSTATSTPRRCSTTCCCSTCRSPPRCTGRSGGSSRAPTSPCGRAASPRPSGTSRRCCTRAADQDAPRRIEAVLRDSVAKHMRADVTVGAFLSGGIDSTAIAALAKEHNPDLSRSPRGSTARATPRWTSRPSRRRRSACGTSSAP